MDSRLWIEDFGFKIEELIPQKNLALRFGLPVFGCGDLFLASVAEISEKKDDPGLVKAGTVKVKIKTRSQK
ncbi:MULTISPECIES: hypothetical protein [unclassified Microcoleus]|uniref:hypothetical protein n=1 Tax=unclassified Microcoleus TaxID=2642155 RepID=UPI002FD093EC